MSSILHLETTRDVPFQMFQPGRRMNGALTRYTTSVDPADRNDYQSSGVETVRFKLEPSLGWVDFGYHNLLFKAEWVGELAKAGASSFFRKIELFGPDSTLLFECDSADLLANILRDVTMNSTQSSSSFGLTDGAGSEAQRRDGQSDRGNGEKGQYFCIQILLEPLRSQRYVAMHGAAPYTVVLTLQRPEVCLRKFDTNNVSFKLSSVSLKLDCVTFDAQTEQTLLAGLAQDKVEYPYQAWGHVSESSAQQVTVLNIPNNYNSLCGILVKTRLTSSTTDVTKNSYASYFGDLREIRIQCGAGMPQALIPCKGRAPQVYWELQKLLDLSNNNSITINNWISNANTGSDNDGVFVFGFNFDKVPGNPMHMSGNTTKSTITIEFHRDSLPPEPILYDIFLLHDRVIKVGNSIGTIVRM